VGVVGVVGEMGEREQEKGDVGEEDKGGKGEKAEKAEKARKAFDLRRLFNFTVLGTVLIGPMLHTWYGFLGTRIPGSGSLATLYR
jgi:hypothetical protein